MKFLLVDDEILSLKYLQLFLNKLYPQVEIVSADNFQDALDMQDESVAVAFLDIEMPGVGGLELAERLVANNSRINIIFVTAHDDYALDAYRIHASGYLTKPYTMEEISREMENLRYPLSFDEKKLRVQCFGNFEVFYGEEPLRFERKGAKEILAYLIHLRGASADRVEVCTAMWKDEEEVERRKAYFRTLIHSLRGTLKEYDSEDVFINRRDSYAVNMDKVDCDYYRYLEGDEDIKSQYHGEYMKQYGWAENPFGITE